MYYKKIRGDEPEYIAWVAECQFIFEKGRNNWVLVSQKLSNNIAPASINEPTGAQKDEMLTSFV